MHRPKKSNQPAAPPPQQQPQQQQQIVLNPIQMMQITDSVLRQMEDWIREKEKNNTSTHKKHDVTALGSLFHSRLLLGVKMREFVQEAQKQQEDARRQAAMEAHRRQSSTLTAAAAQAWKDGGVSHYLDTGRP